MTQFDGASIVDLWSRIPQELYIAVMYLILFIITYKNVIFKYAYTDGVTIEIFDHILHASGKMPLDHMHTNCYHKIVSHFALTITN